MWWQKIRDRASEPSTWAGLSAVALGVGEVAKINEASAVAAILGDAAAGAASGGWAGAVPALIFGAMSIFMREKGAGK